MNKELNKNEKSNDDVILELKDITKKFLGGKVVANDNVSISFNRNEVHSLVGENGSGKSTLMNIIFGLYKQDNGEIFLNNKKVDMYQSGAAKKYKIGMVHQHFHLVDNFTVLENVILGQEEITRTKEEKLKIKSLKKELKEIKSRLSALQKLDSMIIKHVDKGAKVSKEDTNFVDAVLKIIRDRYKIKKEIDNEDHIIDKLKVEKIQTNASSKSGRHRIEEIDNEIEERKYIIKELKKALKLIDEYEHATTNDEQKEVVELAERKSELWMELDIHDVNLTGLIGNLKYKDSLRRLEKIQLKYDIHLDPNTLTETLAVGQRQMVEILKVLWEEKDIIVFDEPTATLSVKEIDALLKTIDALKKEGKTIIFISHKLKEVKAISDRVSILRKGKMMGTYENDAKLTPASIGELMVGKTIELDYPKRKIEKKPLVRVEELSLQLPSGFKSVDNVSFEIYEDEIFGLAGIEGNGQEDIVQMFTNLKKPTHGSISMMREVDQREGKYIMQENAALQSERIFEKAEEEVKKLSKEYLDKEIRTKFRKLIKEAKREALDERSQHIALEGKKSKTVIKEIDNKLKKVIKELEKSQQKELHELHSHKNMSKLHKQVKEIHKQANIDSKNILKEVKTKIKNKEVDTLIWEILTDGHYGYHISDTNRRLIQSHVPIDRLRHGVVPIKDLQFNARMTDFDTTFFSKDGNSKKCHTPTLRDFTSKIIDGMNVEGAFNHQVEIRNLSGGNQQKFVVGREIYRDHKLFIAGHPTRGLDISAIDHIYKSMIENSKGKATLLYSLEINELLAVCDRVAVMYHGKIVDIIDPSKVTLEQVSRMMIGEVE